MQYVSGDGGCVGWLVESAFVKIGLTGSDKGEGEGRRRRDERSAAECDMTQNRRIVLNIVATYGRSLYALVIGLFCGRWTLRTLGEADCGLMVG